MHLTSGEIASKFMVIEFKTGKKHGEDAQKDFFSRFTSVNSLVTIKSTYTTCTIFAPKKSAKKELVIPTDEEQSFAEILSEFNGKHWS